MGSISHHKTSKLIIPNADIFALPQILLWLLGFGTPVTGSSNLADLILLQLGPHAVVFTIPPQPFPTVGN